MVAHQVAGKAVRDGLFLSRFAPSDLPMIVASAAVAAVLLGLGFARLLGRYGPLRLVPAAFAGGAALHLVEFEFLRNGGAGVRAVVITIVYLHLVGFGAILLSGFWSIVNEFFNPREAKLRFGRITGAGTIGGVAGGLLAERGAAWFGVDALLLLLAVLHLGAAATLWRIPADSAGSPVQPETGPVWDAAREAFRQAPFLVNLAVLILLGTLSAALLDYLFKSNAAAEFGKGPALTRYFAFFYAANQVLSFVVQAFLTPVALRRLGLGRTVAWHPMVVAFGAGASLAGPAFVMAPLARSLELVLRGSFLRSGYELFFTPVPPREKRAVKTFIDVGCDRMGDAFGAGVLQLLLLLGPQQAVKPILVIAIAAAGAGIHIARRMDSAYKGVLAHGLLRRAIAVNEADVEDSTTLSALMLTGSLAGKLPAEAAAKTLEHQDAPAAEPVALAQDSVLVRLGELRSGVPSRVTVALRPDLPFDPLVATQAIQLLAWNEVYEWARAFLLLHAHRSVGQLVDALLDQSQDFAIRRRIPRILAYSSSQRAVDGLTAALSDSRFEIRYHAGRALEFLHRMSETLHFDSGAMLASIQLELSVSKTIREGRRLIDQEDNDDQYGFRDEILRHRADKTLEHIFSLLALELPAEPLKVAYRAMHSSDRMLRGLALEYLESNLSGAIVNQLAALVEPVRPAAPPRPRQQVLDELMASQQNILLSLGAQPADSSG
jgi:ATP:ADP antiporter, AAA family